MQRAFIEHDAFQCGYCTPGQIMSAVALLEEGNAGDDADIAEFMSGNICRCAAYPNIRAAIREVARCGRLATLRVGRARAEAVATVSRRPGQRVPGRRDDRGRPDAARASRGPTCWSTSTVCRWPEIEELPGRRPADRRAGADERRRPRPAVAERYPGVAAGAAARRLRAAAQHGLDRRQPLPAGALRVLPRRRLAVQQARARAAAARRWTASTAATRSSAPASTASPPTPPTSRSRSWPSTPSCTRSARAATREIAIDDFYLLPGDTPQLEHPLEHGELIVADRAAAARARAARRSTSSSATASRTSSRSSRSPPRSTSRTGSSPTSGSRSAASAPSRGARAAPSRRWSARPPRRSVFAAPRRRELEPARGAPSTTRSRSSWRSVRSCAALDPGDERGRDEPARSGGPSTASTATRRSPAPRATPARSSSPDSCTPRSSARRSQRPRHRHRQRGRRRAADGVLAVLTHVNLAKIAGQPQLLPSLVGAPAPGESFFPMQDDVVHYAGQPVALVIADSHERAQHAASLVARRVRARALDHDDRRGPRRRRRGPAAVRRADARAATSAATSRRRSPRRTCGSTSPTAWPPTTTTRSSRRPRPRSGTTTG